MNFFGSDWKEIEDYCKLQLSEDVNALKSVAMGIDQTQYHRGRIAVFEQILELPERPRELEAD